jgi:hypothetical protein
MKTLLTAVLATIAALATAQTDTSMDSKQTMQVAVWDTYVKRSTGSVLHFDIIVPESLKDSATVYAYGRAHLSAADESGGTLSSEQCQFCHIEVPSEEIVQSIREKGYYILEMDEIPAVLPANPTRRDLILHLRAHYPQHRFAKFGGISDDELRKMAGSTGGK